jgi:ATP-binding cassette subfamily C protein
LKKILSLIQKTLQLLPYQNRKKIIICIPVAIFLSLLDLIGVILLGTLGTIGYKTLTNDNKPTRLEIILRDILNINTISSDKLIVITGIISVFVLMFKTISQSYFFFKFSRFLAAQEALISVKLFEKILGAQANQVFTINVSQYQYALILGPGRLVNSVLNGLVSLMSDGFNIILLGCVAFIISPLAFCSVVLVFVSTNLLSSKLLKNKASEYGKSTQNLTVYLSRIIIETIRGFKELQTYKRQDKTIYEFKDSRYLLALVNQKTSWISSVQKYIFEVVILLSGVLVSVILIVTTDARRTVSVVVLFLAMGFSLIPSINRIQNAIITFRVAEGSSTQVFELFDKYNNSEKNNFKFNLPTLHDNIFDKIELKNVFLTINSKTILDNINLTLNANQIIGLIGRSGSGKTSLADLIVGINSPSSGQIVFSVKGEPIDVNGISRGYVSQNPSMYSNNFFENIAYGVSDKPLDIEKILRIAQELNLGDFLLDNNHSAREIQMDSVNISGGERQRIAIARALYADSKLIVLDEPSSALDKYSQESLLNSIQKIKKDKTIIIITHSDRLIEFCDTIIELDRGSVKINY